MAIGADFGEDACDEDCDEDLEANCDATYNNKIKMGIYNKVGDRNFQCAYSIEYNHFTISGSSGS